jgi:hypothetical protein
MRNERNSRLAPFVLATVVVAATACQADDAAPGQVSPITQHAESAAAKSCDDDCRALVQAGIEWLIHHRSYEPHEVVLESDASGLTRVEGDRPQTRVVPLEVLDRVAATTGIEQGSRDSVLDCAGATRQNPCRFIRGSTLVRIRPPVIASDGRTGSIFVVHSYRQLIQIEGLEDFWMGTRDGYELSLEKSPDGSWRVIDSVRMLSAQGI